MRLRSIVTDAPLVPDPPFTEDLCRGCDECVKACPVGTLTPYAVDLDRCLLGMPMEQRLSDEYRETYERHSPMVTENMWIMCQTCQRACPVGKEQRSKRIGRGTGPVDERV